MEAINQRVGELVKALGVTPTAFAKSIGKPQSSVAIIIDGRSKPGFDFLEAICNNVPNISRDWLLMGEGNMFRSTQKSADGGAFGEQITTDIAKEISEVRHVFEEELRAKNRQLESRDQQISELHRMLKDTQEDLREMQKMALVGKLDHVAVRRSETPVYDFRPVVDAVWVQIA